MEGAQRSPSTSRHDALRELADALTPGRSNYPSLPDHDQPGRRSLEQVKEVVDDIEVLLSWLTGRP